MFKLKKPNSRFHALFTVRWNAVWILPKHVFEKVADPQKFDFNKPVSLGAYVLNSYDPDGKWFIWQLRDDWQRTTLGRFGKPGPKYLAYVDPGPPDKRVIAQLNHELDVIHDIAARRHVRARQAVARSTVAWFKGFPDGHPDPTLPAVIFNDQLEMFKNRDVRWALALLIDIKAVSMAAYRGAATISAIGVPPTGTIQRPITSRWKRHRLRLVRARLPRVRLRVRHRRLPSRRPLRGACRPSSRAGSKLNPAPTKKSPR